MKKIVENYEDEFCFQTPPETLEIGEQRGESKNLETMFAKLTDLLDSWDNTQNTEIQYSEYDSF